MNLPAWSASCGVQVPLVELLRKVPIDARLVIDSDDGKCTSYIPVGRYCHEAAGLLSAAPAAPAVPTDGGTPGIWFVRRRERNGELLDCFVAAPDYSGFPYAAEILGDDEYREGIDRKLADCQLIVEAVNAHRAAMKDKK